MASIYKCKSGHYRAEVCVQQLRDQKVLPTKKAAQLWAQQREMELSHYDKLESYRRTLGELLQRYAQEVSATKKGRKWEQVRLEMYLKRFPALCEIPLLKLTREDFEMWMNIRLKSVKTSTVNRELNLMSHTLTMA